jgi:hypothetical protein
MTAVIFKFQKPDGEPVVGAPFTVTLRKPTFDETTEEGILLPGVIEGITDAQGVCTLELAPGYGLYYLSMVTPGAVEDVEGCVSGLHYKFIVPEGLVTARVETLIVTSPTWSRPWDEQALVVITEAKVSALASAERAETAAQTIEGDAESARDSAVEALLSKNTAVAAASIASDAATAAGLSEVAAKASEDAADASELAAWQSAITASTQAGISIDASNLAKRWASENENVVVADDKESSYSYSRKAATSATDAAASAGTSGTQAGLATAAKMAAEAAAVTATDGANVASGSAATALTEANRSKVEADRAEGYASALTGSLVEAGSVDLSSNQYPAKPVFSSFWKVVIGGAVGGVDYGIGDTLVYSKTLDQFYKIDNTESVSSVNGKTGAVTLVKADVGLSQVDNTADANKPVSAAQQTALNGKQASAANLTAFAGLTGAIDQLPYFTGAGALSLSTLTAKARLLNARTDAAGMRTEISAASSGANSDITSLSAMTTPLSVTQGGTGGSSQAGAQAALGLVPVSSNVDTTPGRVLTTGWMGLGGNVLPWSGNAQNPDVYLTGGSYWGEFTMVDWNGTGTGSSPVAGYLVVTCGGDDTFKDQVFKNGANGTMFTRSRNSSTTWSGWAKTYNSINATQDPQTLFGLMSSTVVSGWTIEKFANGTCIVAGTFTSASLAANSVTYADITVPTVLVNGAVAGVTASATPTINSDISAINAVMSTDTLARLTIRNGSSPQSSLFRIKIIGRWKA